MNSFQSGENENTNKNLNKKFSPNHALLYELSDLNSSTNSILFTNSSNAANMFNLNVYKNNPNEGPVKVNDSCLKTKYSNSLDKKNFVSSDLKKIVNAGNVNSISKKKYINCQKS